MQGLKRSVKLQVHGVHFPAEGRRGGGGGEEGHGTTGAALNEYQSASSQHAHTHTHTHVMPAHTTHTHREMLRWASPVSSLIRVPVSSSCCMKA